MDRAQCAGRSGEGSPDHFRLLLGRPVNPKDGSLWCSGIGRGDKRLMRLDRGTNPPQTCSVGVLRTAARTADRDQRIGRRRNRFSNGVVWQNWRASGHFSAFDRRKCKSTRDPNATGQSCPEGCTFYRKNDPTYTDSVYHANESYLTHMDVHDVLGLGKNAPMCGIGEHRCDRKSSTRRPGSSSRCGCRIRRDFSTIGERQNRQCRLRAGRERDSGPTTRATPGGTSREDREHCRRS